MSKARLGFLDICLLILSMNALGGCVIPMPGFGTGQLQSARPTAQNTGKVSMGWGTVFNKNLSDPYILFLLGHIQYRRGITDDLDMGLRLMDFGFLVDTKYNFLPKDSDFSVSLLGGLGGRLPVERNSGSVALAQLGVLADYNPHLGDDVLVPYVGLILLNHWFFGWPEPELSSEQKASGGVPVGRTGTGDGVLAMTVGLAFFERYFSVEYGFWTTIYNDPGDYYYLIDNHILNMFFSW